MPETDLPETLKELDQAIDAARDNIRALIEQGSGYSGAADDELLSTRLAEQEARLELLRKVRESIARDLKAPWKESS